MIAYSTKTGFPVDCQTDPLDGGYLLPADSTEVPPPDFDNNTHTCVFEGSQWVVTEIEVPEPVPTPEPISAMDLLRMQRNYLIAETDWRVLSDYPGSNQAEWKTYRQALRDITTQTPSLDENGELTGINWPNPPSD